MFRFLIVLSVETIRMHLQTIPSCPTSTLPLLSSQLLTPSIRHLVKYLETTFTPPLTLSTEAFNTVLSGNMSYAAMGFASPLFERDVSTGGNTILLRSANRYPLAPLSAVLAVL